MQRETRNLARKRSFYAAHPASRRSRVLPALRRIREFARLGPVRRAVFPVSGLDTRFLPATKAAPKEMLTVVDKPLIHYAVEEAIAAGIREMIFVTSRHKRVIEDHFDRAYELEENLAQEQREELLAELRRLFPADVKYLYVREREHGGMGSALLCARKLVEDGPFAVIVPDELIDGRTPAIAQVISCFNAMQQPVVGVRAADGEEPGAEALRSGAAFSERTHHVVRFEPVAHPQAGQLIPLGRYVVTPSIFDYLQRSASTDAGQPDLHVALRMLAAEQSLLAYEIEGERFPCGTKLGLLAANVHFGLKHPDLARPFGDLLRRVQIGVQRQPPRFATAPAARAEGELLGSPRG
jgi:UTP--glucose-1-phosphate uridylyltransferase